MWARRLFNAAEPAQTAGALRRRASRRRPLLPLFLLLLVACCVCGLANGGGTRGTTKGVPLFVSGRTKLPERVDGGELKRHVKFFASPSLVSADGVMVAFAEAHYSEGVGANVDIAARYIGTEGEGWAERVFEGNGAHWKTQLAMQKEDGGDYIYELRNPMAVVKEKKIYLLAAVHKKAKNTSDPDVIDYDWGFELAVGDIKSDAQGGKTIEWKTPKSTVASLTQEFKNKSLYVIPFFGSAFLTGDGDVVFVVAAKTQEDNFVSSIIRLNVTPHATELELSYAGTAEGCFPLLFEWEGKLITLIHCRDDIQSVRESTNMGKTWEDSNGKAARVLDNLKNKGHFTTATIDKKTVLLFNQMTYTETRTRAHETCFWVTDGNRMHDLGPTVTDDHVTSRGLVHTNGELFSLNQQWDKGSNSFFLARHEDKLEKISSVLNTWAEKDAYLSKSCRETAPEGASSDTLCVTPMPTDGLVGFLSSRGNATHWKDEYLFKDAMVRGGTRVKNGYTFSGANSGAQWPVGRQGPSLQYDFTRHGLTVVATVTVHETPESDAPLLTFGGTPKNERLGLWYNRDQQWKVRSNNGGTLTHASGWETNKTYRVALTLLNNTLSAYVNGERVADLPYVPAPVKDLRTIESVFIARYQNDRENSADAAGHVTVTNVFLYNRPLNASEVEALGRRVAGPVEL